MSEPIFISNARLSFPNLIEPQRGVGENGVERISYNCELILPKDHPGYVAFLKAYGALALEKWKDNANSAMQMIQSDRKSRCYGDGSEKVNKKTFKPYDGYVGNAFITCGNNKHAPQIIQADGTPIDPNNTMAYQQLTRKMYGGCRVNAAIKPWLQDNKHGRGVRCDLIAIQFAGDDQPFGEGAPDVSGMFGALQAGVPAAAPAPAMGLPPFMLGQ